MSELSTSGAAFNAMMTEETKESLIAMLFKEWREKDASRAREAKLVEALRSLHAWSRCFVEDTPITAETLWRAFPAAVKRAGEVLADHPYDTPAEMPSDVHPQERERGK